MFIFWSNQQRIFCKCKTVWTRRSTTPLAGIIDPTKVTRLALENVASIAGLLLTTEAVISDEPGPKEAAGGGGNGGMGGMM